MTSRRPILALTTLCLALAPPLAARTAGGGKGGETVRRVIVSPAGDPSAGGDEKVEKKVRVVFVDDGSGPQKVQEINFSPDDPGFTWVSDSSRRGYLGVELVEITPDLRSHFGAPRDAGVMIGSVEPGSPADKAGLLVGDVITAIDGGAVDSTWQLRHHIRGLKDGETTALEVVRGGKSRSLTATVVERERREVDLQPLLRLKKGEGPEVLELDGRRMGAVLKEMQDHFASPQFRDRMRSLGDLESDLQKRLQELETRMQALQTELDRMKSERSKGTAPR